MCELLEVDCTSWYTNQFTIHEHENNVLQQLAHIKPIHKQQEGGSRMNTERSAI